MRFVVLRDDDTNALMPIECLETLYRPFLARGLPVNLAVIPEVRADARMPDGRREGFLPAEITPGIETVPLAQNRRLVEYLHANPGYRVAQHGCHHDRFEFDRGDRHEIVRRLERGAGRLREAGFVDVRAFVAPHDKFSPPAYLETAKRFPVISSGWFEWRRLPHAWKPRYLLNRLAGRPHWRVGGTLLLSHPGCLLSYTRPAEQIFPAIEAALARHRLVVLVTHWWEYFRDGRLDEALLGVLHKLAPYLASRHDVRVTTFEALAMPRPAAAAVAAGSSAVTPPLPVS